MKISRKYKTLIIGCGIRQVKQIKEKCVAIDISQEYLDKAKEIRTDNIYIKVSVENLPFSKNTFKKVIFTHVLEHVNQPKKALNEIYRVLTLDGILYLTVPSKESENFLSKYNLPFKKFLKKYHKTKFDENKLKEFLKNFKTLRIKKIKGKDVVFWWLLGEECDQIHLKKLDFLTRQFSRMLYIINIAILPFFKHIISEYQVIATK